MFPVVLSLADNASPAISHTQEKSRLFYRKVLRYSSENSFWKLKIVHNFIIPKGFSLYKNFQLFIKLTLSYGDEPLLLDQPEDDLDNELIYDLIVRQLRETKTKRQVIVVTHNANIVVNGDAEMVLPLEVVKGQTYVQQPASIQQKNVRESICNILEGGEKAFEQRYRRIHLGD